MNLKDLQSRLPFFFASRPTLAIIFVLPKLPNPNPIRRPRIRICIKDTNIDVFSLVFLFLKDDDSEDDSTYQASGAEGESDGEDDREMGCSQESVIARMQELSLRPEPTLPEEESESDSDAPPPLEAPASQDEDESESEHELLPLQDEGPRPCKELPMTQATESSESESDSDKAPNVHGEMDQVPSDHEDASSEHEAPASPEIVEIQPGEQKYAGPNELFESPMAGNSGPRREVLIEMCTGLMQYLHKHQPHIMKLLDFSLSFR